MLHVAVGEKKVQVAQRLVREIGADCNIKNKVHGFMMHVGETFQGCSLLVVACCVLYVG